MVSELQDTYVGDCDGADGGTIEGPSNIKEEGLYQYLW